MCVCFFFFCYICDNVIDYYYRNNQLNNIGLFSRVVLFTTVTNMLIRYHLIFKIFKNYKIPNYYKLFTFGAYKFSKMNIQQSLFISLRDRKISLDLKASHWQPFKNYFYYNFTVFQEIGVLIMTLYFNI